MSALATAALAVSTLPWPKVHSLTGCTELHSREFVTCDDCPDFDLCLGCFADGEHGHDPSHAFHETIEHSVDDMIKTLCAPGRGVHHAALCDGCDKASVGLFRVRYHITNNMSRPSSEYVTSA